MANTWGAQTWSFNQWNDLSNVNYTLTGQALSFSLGNTTASGEVSIKVGVLILGVLRLGAYQD
jgi:hypothetical protein